MIAWPSRCAVRPTQPTAPTAPTDLVHMSRAARSDAILSPPVTEHPPTRRLSSDTRICVVLTLAEASALVTQFQLDPQAAALNGFVKILTALEHVTGLSALS